MGRTAEIAREEGSVERMIGTAMEEGYVGRMAETARGGRLCGEDG